MEDNRNSGHSKMPFNGKYSKQVNLALDTIYGLAVYAIFGTILITSYIGIFGYGLGKMIHYALADTLGMPISSSTCFYWALIPGLNIIGLFIAAQVLMWKVLFRIGWDALLWLLDVLPHFLRQWSNNLK